MDILQPNMAHSEEVVLATILSEQVEMGIAHHPHQEEPMLLLPTKGQASEAHVQQALPGHRHPTGLTCHPPHRVHGRVQVPLQVHHSPAHRQGQAQVLVVPSVAEEVVLEVDLAVEAAVAPAVAVVAASVEEDNHSTISLIGCFTQFDNIES